MIWFINFHFFLDFHQFFAVNRTSEDFVYILNVRQLTTVLSLVRLSSVRNGDFRNTKPSVRAFMCKQS
jgi:hypothetical protein